MRIPVLTGVIRRRLLVNFRVEPEVIQRLLPAPFRPKLHRGYAIAGICLIRLEGIRPAKWPGWMGISSENAAHRVAVEWTDVAAAAREGVFIPRRDTGSRLNSLAGGRVFPGEHHHARFSVTDDGEHVDLAMESRDGLVSVKVTGETAGTLPESSCFGSLAEASEFFEGGSLGYSVTKRAERLDGLLLRMREWSVRPLAILARAQAGSMTAPAFQREAWNSTTRSSCVMFRTNGIRRRIWLPLEYRQNASLRSFARRELRIRESVPRFPPSFIMKIATAIVGGLLGLLFIFAGLAYFLKFVPEPPPPPEGSPPALFMGAFGPTGYFDFIKVLEILGGMLVAIPRTRNFGLLVLGPILVNILAFHAFVMKGEGLLDPMILLITAAAAFLLWAERRAFAALGKPVAFRLESRP